MQKVANKNRQTGESKSFTVSLFHRRGELRSSLAKCNVKFVYAIDSPSRSSCACVLSARRGHLHDLGFDLVNGVDENKSEVMHLSLPPLWQDVGETVLVDVFGKGRTV